MRKRKKPVKNFRVKLSKKFLLILIAVFAFVFLYLVLRIYAQKSVWDQQSKFAIVVPLENNDVAIVVLDPASESLVKLTIPRNTSVEASNQLGSYQIGSIYQLGLHQGTGGDLLKNTVQKSFHLSVEAWADENVLDLVSPNPIDIVKGVFGNFSSDLSIKDKLKLAFYSIKSRGINRMNINLADTSNLIETKFVDGQDGFVAKKQFSPQVLAYFTDSSIAQKNPKVQINNFTDSINIPQGVGQSIEVLGGSVMSIVNNLQTKQDLDCEVVGQDKQLVEKISYAFGCEPLIQNTRSNYDLVINLGEKFASRY